MATSPGRGRNFGRVAVSEVRRVVLNRTKITISSEPAGKKVNTRLIVSSEMNFKLEDGRIFLKFS